MEWVQPLSLMDKESSSTLFQTTYLWFVTNQTLRFYDLVVCIY